LGSSRDANQRVTDKLKAFERHADDVSSELKEVRHDLPRATDTAQQIHQMEMRLDERRIREHENKRGPKGVMGPRGPQGERGLVGLPGKGGKDGAVVTIKKWENPRRISGPQRRIPRRRARSVLSYTRFALPNGAVRGNLGGFSLLGMPLRDSRSPLVNLLGCATHSLKRSRGAC
jgi:hypothetical protein